MAIYHLHLQNISRGKGRSVVAASAYRAGQKITNQLDGITHDYTKKNDVVYTEIIVPDHAPDWTKNREKLWNNVEQKEKASNARFAKEINIALPIELNKDQQQQLLLEYTKDNFIKNGMVADLAIHDKQDGNPHAHILLTNRPFNQDGSWGEKSKKQYMLDSQGEKIKLASGEYKSRKIELTNWNDKSTLEGWRKSWELTANKHLELAHQLERIDSRSYIAQGLQIQPTIHLGPNANQMEKRGLQTDRGDLNRLIKKDNHQLLKLAKQERNLVDQITKKEKVQNRIQDKLLQKEQLIHQQPTMQIDELATEDKKTEIEKTLQPTLAELKQANENLVNKMLQLIQEKENIMQLEFTKIAKTYIEKKYQKQEQALAQKHVIYTEKVDKYNKRSTFSNLFRDFTGSTYKKLNQEYQEIQTIQKQIIQDKQDDKQTITFDSLDNESRKIKDYCYEKNKEQPVIQHLDKKIEELRENKLVIDKQIGAINKEKRREIEQTRTITKSRGMDFSR